MGFLNEIESRRKKSVYNLLKYADHVQEPD